VEVIEEMKNEKGKRLRALEERVGLTPRRQAASSSGGEGGLGAQGPRGTAGLY